MPDHDAHFRQQVARERHDGLARDYRLAQPQESSENADRSPRLAWLPRRLRQLHLRRRHAPGVPTLMRTDPELIAARLGIDAAHVQRLQERGYLTRLELSEAEIRERLYTAHVRAVAPVGASATPRAQESSGPENRVVGP